MRLVDLIPKLYGLANETEIEVESKVWVPYLKGWEFESRRLPIHDFKVEDGKLVIYTEKK